MQGPFQYHPLYRQQLLRKKKKQQFTRCPCLYPPLSHHNLYPTWIEHRSFIWGFPELGVSQNGWFRKIPFNIIKLDDDWGSPYDSGNRLTSVSPPLDRPVPDGLAPACGAPSWPQRTPSGSGARRVPGAFHARNGWVAGGWWGLLGLSWK